jgi:hypothetical protein
VKTFSLGLGGRRVLALPGRDAADQVVVDAVDDDAGGAGRERAA